MAKTYATIYVEKEVLHKAKTIGLNISKTCENALKDAIRRLEAPTNQNKGGTGTVGFTCAGNHQTHLNEIQPKPY